MSYFNSRKQQILNYRSKLQANHKGSRIKAWCDAGMITMHYLSELDPYENHLKAALRLMQKLGWDNELIGGYLKHDCVFVQVAKVKGE